MTKQPRVKLPRPVADEIEQFRYDGFETRDILEQAINSKGGEICDYAANVSFDALVSALVNGYDVKGTPHDEVSAYYNEMKRTAWDYPEDTEDPHYHYARGAEDAIDFVLDELNIKIKGVNAE